MNEPIDHHYLPVFYINRWCNAGGKVFRYYRPHGRVVASPIAPDNTGYEPYLYTLPGHSPGRQQVLETDFMAKVDAAGSEVRRIMIDQGVQALDERMRTAWTLFLMTMNVRVPHALAEISTTAHEVVRQNLLADCEEYLTHRENHDPPTAYEWMEQNAPHVLANVGKMFLPRLADNEKVGQLVINMDWTIVDLSRSEFTLLTGDRPLIRTHGLGHPRCVWALPLGPRLLFLATNTRQRRQEILGFLPSWIARKTNIDIVSVAVRHVYGSSADHLTFIENRLRRIPLDITPFA